MNEVVPAALDGERVDRLVAMLCGVSRAAAATLIHDGAVQLDGDVVWCRVVVAKVGESHPDPTHSPILGVKLAEKLKATGVAVEFHSNTDPNEKFPSASAFLIDRLKK